MKNRLFHSTEVSPDKDILLSASTKKSGQRFAVTALALLLVVGCSRLVDLDDEERYTAASSSCVTCHTSETVLLALLGDEIPGDEGGGGG